MTGLNGSVAQPAHANEQPAFALYQRGEASGIYQGLVIQASTFEGEQLAEVTTFLNPALFLPFGLPAKLKVTSILVVRLLRNGNYCPAISFPN